MMPRVTRAFTLIEMLVVLVIVAIVTTLAVLAFSGRADAREIRITGESLAQVMTVASQEAVIYPGVLGLRFDAHGYHFYRYDLRYMQMGGGWTLLKNDNLSRPNAFPAGVMVHVIHRENYDVHTSNVDPEIVFYPNGQVSPVTIALTNTQKKPVYHLAVQSNGTTTLKEVS
jgi:general secretion pathway protein H